MANRKNWGEGFARQNQAAYGGNRGSTAQGGSRANQRGFGQQQGGNRGGQGHQGTGNRNNSPQWGGGSQGEGGGNQGGGGNRFAALAGLGERPEQQTGARSQSRLGPQPQQQSQDRTTSNNAQGRGTQQSGGQQADWRRALEHDNANERPIWPLSCYSHLRSIPGQSGGGGPNDVDGDFCFEELRWAQVQAARAGASPLVLCQEMDAARQAQQAQLRNLSRGRQAPSLGGPPLPHISTFLPPSHSLLTFGHGSGQIPTPFGAPPATPFGQVVGAFGRNPSVAAQPSVFGGASTAQPSVFGGGPAAQPSVFGGASTAQPSIFGGGSAAQPSGFGGGSAPQGNPGFVQQSGQSTFGSGLQQTAWASQQTSAATGGAFGRGTTFGSAFGGPPPSTVPPTPWRTAGQPGNAPSPPVGAFGGEQGGFPGVNGLPFPPTPATPTWNQSTNPPEGSAPAEGVVEVSAEDKVWVAPQFERGGIPDTPPPAIFCN